MKEYDLIDYEEVLIAGERAINSLNEALECMDSAANWGLFDMIGGGFLATMVKRSKMKDGQRYLEQAKYDLEQFRDELQDVDLDFSVDIGSFLGIADYLFDNLFVDFMVQSNINETRNKIKKAIDEIETICYDIQKMFGIEDDE